jgi:hypothetical protein
VWLQDDAFFAAITRYDEVNEMSHYFTLIPWDFAANSESKTKM